MPDANALSIEIRTAAGWRFAVAAMTLAATAGLGWWGMTASRTEAAEWVWLGVPAVLVIMAAASMFLSRGGRLGWDGVVWHLDDSVSGPRGEQPGTLAVALDGGHWMLLRFRTTKAGARPRASWLALSRRDLGGQWHALRCAVYSPRPDPAGRPAQAPATPSA
jgi:hypothetical protein